MPTRSPRPRLALHADLLRHDARGQVHRRAKRAWISNSRQATSSSAAAARAWLRPARWALCARARASPWFRAAPTALTPGAATAGAGHLGAGVVATVAADLRDAQAAAVAVDAAQAQHGPIDVLVNSAGAAKRTPPDEYARRGRTRAGHYFTYIHLMDPVVKHMRPARHGGDRQRDRCGGKSPSAIHLPGGAANAALMLASARAQWPMAPRGCRWWPSIRGLTLTERLKEHGGRRTAAGHQRR